jgi:hypothetical protein
VLGLRWLDKKYGEQFRVDSYVTVKPAIVGGTSGLRRRIACSEPTCGT